MKKLVFVLLFINSMACYSQPYEPTWQSLNQRKIPSWYGNAKFGIFIHWGVYSVPAWATNSNADGFGSGYAEWYWQRLNAPNLKIHKEFVDFHNKTYGNQFAYKDFATQFKCELFNPQQWASIIKNSGAKYVVLTSKHHDGFCLWQSPQAPGWNAVETGPKRDLVNDLSAAVRNSGLKMGYYYSLYEWYNEQYKKDVPAYVNTIMLPQIKNLVTTYKPDILWTDGEWEQNSTTWQSKETIAWLYNQSVVKDSIIINDRWGSDARGNITACIQTSEYGSGTIKENAIWEETRGIGESFGYNRNESLEQYASSKALIHQLIKVVAKGGNLLLNIGPNADGTIPVIMQQRLKDIGDWLHINGEAIYNTQRWQQAPKMDSATTTFFTQNGSTVYCLPTKWVDKIEVNVAAKPKSISLLGCTTAVKFSFKKNKLTIYAPTISPAVNHSLYAWACKIEW
jgi:alpha-L-fucosidase